MQFKEIGGPLQACAYVPSQATAGTDDNWPVWQAPAGCTVTGAVFVPSAAVTADPTNNAVYTLTRRRDGGSATTVATRSWADTDSVASTPESMALSGTAANLVLAAGDTLEVVKTHGGTGLVVPDGMLVVTYELTG